jgi:hypothetical protein
MKTIEEFLVDLDSLDIKLWVEGENLCYSAPPGAMTVSHKQKIKERKTEIREFLNEITNYNSIQPVERNKTLPLSFAQQSVWLVQQLNPNSFAYNESIAFKILGSLNIKVLEASINEIIRRHEILRTNFIEIDGQPTQKINPYLTINLPILDLCKQEEFKLKILIEQQAQTKFDLACDPLFRFSLFKINTQEYILFFTIHHIICDGWSLGIFLQELSILYEAFCLGNSSPLVELSIQYADFAVWQRKYLQEELLATQINYWQKQLNNLSVLDSVTEQKELLDIKKVENKKLFQFSQELSESIKVFSLQQKVTLFMTLLTAFKIVLYYYTNSEDSIIGTDVANRNPPETEKLIGFFVNQLVLRTDLGGNPTFKQLLNRVRQVTLEAYANRDLPFEKLVKILNPDRNLDRPPLFQAKIMFRNFPLPSLQLKNLKVNTFDICTNTNKFDLFLSLEYTSQGIGGFLEFDPQLFQVSTIEKIISQLEIILTQITINPKLTIERLQSKLKEADRQNYQVRKQNYQKKLSSIKRKSLA